MIISKIARFESTRNTRAARAAKNTTGDPIRSSDYNKWLLGVRFLAASQNMCADKHSAIVNLIPETDQALEIENCAVSAEVWQCLSHSFPVYGYLPVSGYSAVNLLNVADSEKMSQTRAAVAGTLVACNLEK